MKYLFLLFSLALFAGSACKSNTADHEVNSDTDQVELDMDQLSDKASEGAEKMKDWLENNSGDKKIEMVGIQELKALLPDELNGLRRERIKGEGVGALGFKLNQAEAEYQKGDKNLELHIVDFGGFGPALLALASWTVTDVYHEDEDGYEKVTEWNGFKAFEKSNRKDKISSIALIYKNRLIINAEADGMDIQDLKELLEDEILDELDDLDIPDPD